MNRKQKKADMPDFTVVAIDGPAGAGKSSVAKALAKKLGYFFVDTGAMYRALTLKAMRNNVNLEDEQALIDMAKHTNIELDYDGLNVKVLLDGKDVSEDIRDVEVTNQTFHAARTPGVREIMVDLQRKIGSSQNIVIEGRDVTTVVFPRAQYKFYLDAGVEERARRRIKELREKGKEVDEAQLLKDIKERDHRDMTRLAGALKKAEDAIVIDSSELTVDGTVQEMFKYIKK